MNKLNNTTATISNDSLFIINNPLVTNVYSVYLTEEITAQKNYRDLFDHLRNADPSDNFIIYINNFGGYVHTGIDIINSMSACSGHVNTCITGPVYSMAPLIAMQGEKIYVHENMFMMFHDYSGGTGGKGHEQQSAILNDKPFFDSFFTRMTKGFLSKQEIDKVLKGGDVYINHKETIKRLKKMGKLGNKV